MYRGYAEPAFARRKGNLYSCLAAREMLRKAAHMGQVVWGVEGRGREKMLLETATEGGVSVCVCEGFGGILPLQGPLSLSGGDFLTLLGGY